MIINTQIGEVNVSGAYSNEDHRKMNEKRVIEYWNRIAMIYPKKVTALEIVFCIPKPLIENNQP